MIENIKKLGPYVVIGDNLAIPHSQKDDSVLKTGMGLLILKKPVLFPNDRKVQVILSFASWDNKEHLSSLADLVELVTNYNLIENLIKAKSVKQVLKCINFRE